MKTIDNTPNETTERAAFEALETEKLYEEGNCGSLGVHFERDPDGDYKRKFRQSRWEGWKARAALPPTSAEPAQGKLLNIGATMANVMYNYKQKAGHVVSNGDAMIFADLCRQWDFARCEYSAPAAPVADTGAVSDAERIAHLEGEEEISEAVIGTMSRLLASIAITLKGEEAALKRHSYHDLPELVKVMAIELDLYKTIYGNKVPEGWENATAASTATADSAADARDAARYRWLLGHYARGDGYSDIDAALNDGEPEKYLSPAIDAAIASMHPTTGDKE